MSDVESETLASERPDTSTQAIFAWQNAPDEPLSLPIGPIAELQYYVARRRAKLAAVLTFTAVAAVVLVLTPAPQHTTVGVVQAPIIAPMPPPPKPQAPPVAPPKPQAPPVAPPKPQAAPPPVQHPEQAAPPVSQSAPNAHQAFTQALRGDTRDTHNGAGLHLTDPANVDSEAAAMCQDLRNGGSIQPYIDGTLQKSPSLAPWQAARAVRQAVQAYCPQYANR